MKVDRNVKTSMRVACVCTSFALIFAPWPGSAREQTPAVKDDAKTREAASDKAVQKALEFLKSAQNSDGSWDSGSFGKATSVTSLAVMAYLSAGHLPGEPGRYRETIEKGVAYVVASQRPNGMLVTNTSHGPMYCHGISTLMLAEVVGVSRDRGAAAKARSALVKAVELILQAQNEPKNADNSGGWRYQPNSHDSDLSVTGWQLMALRAARSVGCNVPSNHIERALDYVRRCAVKDGGFAYQPGQSPNNPRTGAGVLALELGGEHLSSEAKGGATYLIKHPPRWSSEYFFYEVYYCSQAMYQMGDEFFGEYYPKLAAILLSHQDADGSWLSGDGNDRSGGRVYCTASAVLALAVEYGYLPIYQR